MAFNVKKGTLPTWHPDYSASSIINTDPHARNYGLLNQSTGYVTTHAYVSDMGSVSKRSTLYSSGQPESSLIYRGCGLLYEATSLTWTKSTYYSGTQGTRGHTSAATGTSTTVTIKKSGNNLTITKGATATTFSNVPPLIYFELVGGGGGGSGSNGSSPGAGGGGGAGIAGILDFTNSDALTYGFSIIIGGGGSGGKGYTNVQTSIPNGGDGRTSQISLNKSQSKGIWAYGGTGGRVVKANYSSSGQGGAGGKAPVAYMWTGTNQTANGTVGVGWYCDNTVYILKALAGGAGGKSGPMSSTKAEAQGDNTTPGNVVLSTAGGNLALNSLNTKSGGGWTNSNPNIWNVSAGTGGASMLGPGGNGAWNTASGSYGHSETPSGYGGGGGGGCAVPGMSSGADSDGASGSPGVLRLYWVTLT